MSGNQGDIIRKYLDLAGVFIVALNEEGNITLINKKGYEILDYKEGELNGKNWFETCLPEYRKEEVSKVFKELMRGEFTPVEFHQNPVVTSTGEERVISWHNNTLHDNNGNIIGTLSSGEDITDLIESEEKFKTITEQSVASISIFQKNEILYINNVFSEVIGYPYKKIFSWQVDELLEKIVHSDDLERVMNLSKKTRAGLIDTTQNTQFKIIRKNGEIRWINSFFRSISYKNKPAALNFFLDITDMIKSEQIIKESERRYRDLYEEAPAAYFSIGSDKFIKKCNKAAESLLGYSENELLNMKVFDLYAKTKYGLEKAKKIFKRFISAEEIRDEELQMRKKSGDHIWISLSVKPVTDREGKVIASRSVVLDISERKKLEEDFRASKENLTKMFDSIPVGIHMYRLEEDGRLIFINANPAADKILNVDNKQFIGKTIEEAFPPLIEIEVPEKYREVAAEGKSWKFERIDYKDEKIRGAFEVDTFQISPNYMAAAFIDITDRIKIEKQLKKQVKERTKQLQKSEEKYRLISENAMDLIAVLNNKYEHEYINEEAYFNVLGYSKEDLLGKKPFDIIHPDDLNRFGDLDDLENLIPEFKAELRLKHKNGGYIWVESRNKVFTTDTGISKIIAISRDISNRKVTEEKLIKSEWEKKVILESISELIVFQDLDNTVLWVNKVAGDSLNMEPHELIGHKCFKLWHQRNEVCINCPIKETIEKGSPQSNEITTPDGRVWFIKGFPVKDDKDNVVGAVEVTFEITKLKEAEEKFRETNERMNLYRSLFAHDINNIFNNIKMASELSGTYLNDPIKLEKLKDLYHIIEEQIIRGDKLIRNVKRLTSLEESKFPIKQENVRQILSNSIEFLYNSFPNREININKEIFQGKIFVNANELLLDVFENLLINSVKHNKNPRVEINIAVSKAKIEDKRFIKLEFKDNGIGISDKRKLIIFQKGKEIKGKGSGLGLGLSLVKKIIDSFEGKIWVEDRIKEDYKKGSNFVALIPEV